MKKAEVVNRLDEMTHAIMAAIAKPPTKKGHIETQDYLAKALQIAVELKKELKK